MIRWALSLGLTVLAVCAGLGFVEWRVVGEQRRLARLEQWRLENPNEVDYPVYGGFWRPEDPFKTSDYDDIFRYVGARSGWDWRLISAIARAESRYDPGIVSPMGAAGLMQVMPDVAERLGVSGDRIFEPMENVGAGVAHLNEIVGVLRFPEWVGERDRLSIILASYNSGLGHVLDARRLAVEAGENYNSWAVVARYLRLKADPEHFENELARAGEFAGAQETTAFVARVMGYYEAFGGLCGRFRQM